ncbi:DUF4244 domain-containing protein [Alloscardovia theropitheci]|uniref:DUF4244 domain-containing protein n=1 Tax=Alloscardovia theropitheci TaxID=2496842 RepID=A0A4R0QY93_9BIFI|nr:DUF4244 domain-containing protein [Alloscardovia theropitheci]
MKEMINRIIVDSNIALRAKAYDISEKIRKEDKGMATAEYAIVLVAATSFAGLLVALLKSEAVRSILSKLVTDALSII